MIYLHLFLFLVSSERVSEKCLLDVTIHSVVLKIGENSVDLPADPTYAKILKCQKWKNFNDLYQAEVQIGRGGTKTDDVYSDLIILDSSKNPMPILFEKSIDGAKSGKSRIYKLEKSKDGKPVVFFPDSDRRFELNYKKP